MSTITRQAGGASAYSRTSYSTLQPLDDLSGFGADNQENPAQDWTLVIDELLRIRNLEDDWDGEGTEAPHPTLVDGAIRLARALQARGVPPPNRVHACVNPTVNFEWHTPLYYVEIEVVSPVEAEYRSVRKGSMATDGQKNVRW